MAANRVKKFVTLINERDKKLELHCKGESWETLCQHPQERVWYAENIKPLDEDIVAVANAIIAKFSIPCRTAKTIQDVYKNQWLTRLIVQKKEIQEEESENGIN
ncbi:MAG: hypothetical protein IJY90_01420 [Clostridia bacterium]|nr:hypothetical protein [Clostridia bacterium]